MLELDAIQEKNGQARSTLVNLVRAADLKSLSRLITQCQQAGEQAVLDLKELLVFAMLDSGYLYNQVGEDPEKLIEDRDDILLRDDMKAGCALLFNEDGHLLSAPKLTQSLLSDVIAGYGGNITPLLQRTLISELPNLMQLWHGFYFSELTATMAQALSEEEANKLYQQCCQAIMKRSFSIRSAEAFDRFIQNGALFVDVFMARTQGLDPTIRETRMPMPNLFYLVAAKGLLLEPDRMSVLVKDGIERFGLDVFNGAPSISQLLQRELPEYAGEIEKMSFDVKSRDIAERVQDRPEEDEDMGMFII